MIKPWLLRLHRWLTLAFALPLAVIILSGLILSVEPAAQVVAAKPGSVTAEKLVALLAQHDPEGKARSLSFRAYENRLSIGGVRPDDTIDVDVVTGRELTEDGTVSNLFYYSRVLHETLMLDLGWLVHLSTMAMVLLMVIGIAMGWPRLANTVSGWHKGVAWGLLPLLVLSPLTGLFLAWGISFTSPPPAGPRGAPVSMVDAVRKLGESHDLSNLVWIRGRGGRLLARVVDGGEFRVYAVGEQGLTATSRNWVRLFHEGNFAGIWSALMNVVISIALVGLMGTGLVIWARRRFRKRRPRPTPVLPQAVTTG
ncbi:PepSY-associated TM helix domain-containing protein [Phreatobacter sp.]|uniref:PepSY-associated TM helix domain-containing protein n=1 Tax=Phreatobacter sp. TaxID=1966341 RepID=UPI0022BB386E|nr:PepSY-associated TM helix domain-containing protein [Phreatobacter sp.]MCZ8315019.1 PepSY-associated TM helix domain-containing protein [Phreatobacter sp.]